MKENTGKIGRETLGKFFYDLAKIVFTGLVVGGVISAVDEQERLGYIVLISIGVIITGIFVFIGYEILNS